MNHPASRNVAWLACLAFFSLPAAAAPVEEAWVQWFDRSAEEGISALTVDEASDLAIDVDGNVYVVGFSEREVVTVKYAADGQKLWVAYRDTPQETLGELDQVLRAPAVTLDGPGNAYVTAHLLPTGPGEDETFEVIKYDGSGQECWVARYDDGSAPTDAAVIGVAVDVSGNVYAAGPSRGAFASLDYLLVKFDSAGDFVWERRWTSSGAFDALPTALALGGDGSPHLTGEARIGPLQYDYLTLKYDADGNLQWEAQYDGPSQNRDYASALAVTADGSVYVTGASVDPDGTRFATAKYAADGTELWVRRFDDGGFAADAAVDSSGGVVIAGGNFVTVRYDSQGMKLWDAKYLGENDPLNVSSRELALDANDAVYVVGRVIPRGPPSDIVTVKYDAGGNELWTRTFDGMQNGGEHATAIAVDGAGHVLVGGVAFTFVEDAEQIVIDEGSDVVTIQYVQVLAEGRRFTDSAPFADEDDLVAFDSPDLVGDLQVSAGGALEGDAAALNDGVVNNAFVPEDGTVVTLTLDTTARPSGFDIYYIFTLTAATDGSHGQNYHVDVAPVGEGFRPLARVVEPAPVDADQLQTTMHADLVREPIVTGVERIRFTFFDIAGVGPSSYREIDVYGSQALCDTPCTRVIEGPTNEAGISEPGEYTVIFSPEPVGDFIVYQIDGVPQTTNIWTSTFLPNLNSHSVDVLVYDRRCPNRFADEFECGTEIVIPPPDFVPSSGNVSTFNAQAGDLLSSASPTFGSFTIASGGPLNGSDLRAINNDVVYGDGSFQDIDGQRAFVPSKGTQVVITLDLDESPSGYDILRVVSLTGAANGQSDQFYRFEISRVGETQFSELGTVERLAQTDNEVQVSMNAQVQSTHMATRVERLRLTFLEGGNAYREIDVLGRPHPVTYRRGEVNLDGKVDISDPRRILDGLFIDGEKLTCAAAADANADEKVDISDAVFLFDFLFLGGRPPPPPFQDCSRDLATQLPCGVSACP